MEKIYIEKIEGDYRIAGTRVSLEPVILAFLNGLSPEVIASECFPSLTLEQVYGAVTYYLAHRSEIDEIINQAPQEYEALRLSIKEADPSFYRKLTATLYPSVLFH